jgi:prevent-host-death family protein
MADKTLHQKPAVSRVPLAEARRSLGALVERVSTDKERFILEQDGLPVAALVDIDEFQNYLELQDAYLNQVVAESRQEYLAGKSRPGRGAAWGTRGGRGARAAAKRRAYLSQIAAWPTSSASARRRASIGWRRRSAGGTRNSPPDTPRPSQSSLTTRTTAAGLIRSGSWSTLDLAKANGGCGWVDGASATTSKVPRWGSTSAVRATRAPTARLQDSVVA